VIDDKNLTKKYAVVLPFLDEKQKRLVVASDVILLGQRTISQLSKASGLSRPTIYKGLHDIQSKRIPDGRIRDSGGGRKSIIEKHPAFQEELEALVDPVTRGDPMSPLRWTFKAHANWRMSSNPKAIVPAIQLWLSCWIRWGIAFRRT